MTKILACMKFPDGKKNFPEYAPALRQIKRARDATILLYLF